MTAGSEAAPRIAVVGAYGNGKTTLAALLERATGLPRTHARAMRDPLGGSGRSLEDCSPAELIQLTVRRFSERLVGEACASGGFISDGSALHEWVYAKVRLVLGRFPGSAATLGGGSRSDATSVWEEVVDQIGLLAHSHAQEAYDLVVHLPADLPLPCGHQPISEAFRRISDRLLLETLRRLEIPVHVVTGTPDERLAACLRLAATIAPDGRRVRLMSSE